MCLFFRGSKKTVGHFVAQTYNKNELDYPLLAYLNKKVYCIMQFHHNYFF